MTHIRLTDPGDLFVRVLEDAGATPQETARFAHLRTPEGRLAATLMIRAGVAVGKAVDSCAETERRLREQQ